MRDNANGCAVNGIMNAVELNVGNLGLWLAGKAPYATDVGHIGELHQRERIHSLLLGPSRHASRSQPHQRRDAFPEALSPANPDWKTS